LDMCHLVAAVEGCREQIPRPRRIILPGELVTAVCAVSNGRVLLFSCGFLNDEPFSSHLIVNEP
jgi:hypothetical protein